MNKSMKKMFIAMLLVLSLILSLGVVAMAADAEEPEVTEESSSAEKEDAKEYETKTYEDENGETITEVYDEEGNLIHKEEPYYEKGEKTATLCYDAEIECSFSGDTYTTQSWWILPVIAPEQDLDKCLSFTLNLTYYYIEDPQGLGKQVIYYRVDDIFQKAGYLDMDEFGEEYSMDITLKSPKKVDGFCLMAYKPSKTGSFSLGCRLTDVSYLIGLKD